MTRFAIYLDDDSQDASLIRALRRTTLAVAVCREEGMNGANDAAQLQFAIEHNFVLYTANVRDFELLHRALLRSGGTHPGIIYHPRHRFSVGEQAKRILRLWESLTAEDMANRTESLSQWGDDRDS